MVAARIRLPSLYPKQEIYGNWDLKHPNAQILIAPSGTKVGKSFGSGTWLARRALSMRNGFHIWIAPTFAKAKIGYRYLKYFIPRECADFTDYNLEIKLKNGSVIKFLHGHDAETTVEGEAVDSFVIDESGKIDKQVFYSLFTTISQTKGKGIITGTPRGRTWYYDEFMRAQSGDPFYVWTRLKTSESPYVDKAMIANAKRLLPKYLYDQYYNAEFVSNSSTFGDFSNIFDESFKIQSPCKFWLHPNADLRMQGETVTGWDIAQRRDWSVFTTVGLTGKLLGYARFNGALFETQVARLKEYMHTYFGDDRFLRYDATGIGNPIGEMINEADIDASITPVMFTNKSKAEMVGRYTVACESGWFKTPRIEEIYNEMTNYEVTVTKSGLHSYNASSGATDDVVSSLLLSVSGAYQLAAVDDTDGVLKGFLSGTLGEENEDSEGPEITRDSFFDKDDDIDFDLEE